MESLIHYDNHELMNLFQTHFANIYILTHSFSFLEIQEHLEINALCISDLLIHFTFIQIGCYIEQFHIPLSLQIYLPLPKNTNCRSHLLLQID